MSNKISEDDFKCGICFELLIDPTTLTCGHSMCRYCLAQWWCKSKKATCPECRQIWQGFPKVNVTLRNTVEALYPEQTEERRRILCKSKDYASITSRFEADGKKKEPSIGNSLNWTTICVLVAITIAIAVIIGVAVKTVNGLSQKDLMSKSLHNWSPQDVGLWIGGLGPWAKGTYDKKFISAGIDGSLLQQLKDSDLKSDPINMMSVQRRILLAAIRDLEDNLSHHPTGFWEYKERKSGMAMFIMFGLREFPRSTLTYLYLLNYWDTFLPIFFTTVTTDGKSSLAERMEMMHDPTLKNWLEFIPKFLCIPYYLVGTFASFYLDINYWTSRVVILHAILMTGTEFTKASFLFTGGIRQLPYLAVKYFLYVVISAIFFKFVWPFVPFFIADCIFYWILYVSPFDALNRLRRRFINRGEGNNNGGHNHHDHNHHLHAHGRDERGWHFNFEWNNR